MTTVDDVSYLYLDLMDQLDLRDALVVGVGLGGWLACEIAIKTTARISHLVMGTRSASSSATAKPATTSISGR